MNQILYEKLVQLAKNEELTFYSKIAPLLNLSMDNEDDRDKIAQLLGEIAKNENQQNRPMLTALVIHKGNDNNPGEGFFSIAKELNLYDGSRDQLDRVTFWVNQVRKVYNYWQQHT
jgi:hypothetical protein